MLVLELELDQVGPLDVLRADAVTRVERQGIRLTTLALERDLDDVCRRTYDLVHEGVVDDPSGDGTFVPYEVFAEELFEQYYLRWADGQFIAKHDDVWVGLVNPQPRAGGRAELGITVVHGPYRRKGVARALKLLGLEHLQRVGCKRVRTKNSPANQAVLRLNRSLGFLEVPPT